MKRLKHTACACAFLIGICVHAYAGAPGTSCADAIELGKDYSASIQKGQSVWYAAWTFDLPLTVTFAPANGANDPAPEVEMDFTCTPGFYEDSILCSLFCQTSGSNSVQFEMPHKPKLDSKPLEDGTFVYYLSLGEAYRDLLLQMGISYNLAVYVKVTYKSNGVISMAPDDLFSNCVDGAPFMHIGDVVQVEAQDKENHVLIPYVQWQNDTIVYKWTGTTPCTMAVANKCDFDPTNNIDGKLLQFHENIQPGDSIKVQATTIYQWVNNPAFKNEAGMYFAKFYSDAPGEMKITKAQQTPPRGKATLLRFDRTYALNANETALFAIPNSWNDDTLNTQFKTPTEHVFRMSIATDPDFSEEHTLKTYQFEKTPNGHYQGIKANEMVDFWKKTSEQYLYIRFDCSEATTVTPSKWTLSDCVKDTKNYIHSLDTAFVVKNGSLGGYYRLTYSQWTGGDLTIKFAKQGTTTSDKCKVCIASDCNITLSATAANMLFYQQLTSTKKSVTIPAADIASWADRVEEDGYIYARFDHDRTTGKWEISMKSQAPAETDPVYPTATISVSCDGSKNPFLEVSKAQTITIRDGSGKLVQTIDAQPKTKHSLSILSAGKYTLQGENETITLNL